MSEQTGPIRIFSLREVTQSIQRTLRTRYGSLYWIQAEMIKLNPYPHSGHCFPELAEKADGKIVARMRAVLWKDDYRRINERFLSLLREPLTDGIKVLLLAKITFDPVHGIALHITDIDPAYTLGDLEKEKRETLERLTKEGLIDRNRRLGIPLLPARIAVISVETSKGYADFRRILEDNPGKFGFFHMLFPAVLQGIKSAETMIRQLRRIRKVSSHFDVVAIIRGGGDDLGFSSYNDYQLAREIALCPLPVITGIGHATNETVADRVAAANAITPTKMAEDLLTRFRDFSLGVQEAHRIIHHEAESLLLAGKNSFGLQVRHFRSVTETRLLQSKNQVQRQSVSVIQQARFTLRRHFEAQRTLHAGVRKGAAIQVVIAREILTRIITGLARETVLFTQGHGRNLENLQKNVINLDPVNVLKRGYSITLIHGKAIKTTDEITGGDEITSRLYQGSFTSRITSVQPEKSGNHG